MNFQSFGHLAGPFRRFLHLACLALLFVGSGIVSKAQAPFPISVQLNKLFIYDDGTVAWRMGIFGFYMSDPINVVVGELPATIVTGPGIDSNANYVTCEIYYKDIPAHITFPYSAQVAITSASGTGTTNLPTTIEAPPAPPPLSQAATARLVQDINTTDTKSSSDPTSIVRLGTKHYFNARDRLHGAELWQSDGTEEGTSLLKDIFPGSANSAPVNLAAIGDLIVFFADDGIHGRELWSTDGTTEGTKLLKDLSPGTGNSNPIDFKVTPFAGALFFGATTSQGAALWRTDGTPEGTYPIRTNEPEVNNPHLIQAASGSLLYFAATTIAEGRELWVTDGTPNGTKLLKDITPGPLGSTFHGAFAFGDHLLLGINTPDFGNELWITDGSSDGTALLKDINQGTASSDPFGFAEFGGVVYFDAIDGVHGAELWKTDGTAAGTELAVDINPGSESSYPRTLVTLGDRLLFAAKSGSNPITIWKSDGTTNGTEPLVEWLPATELSLTFMGRMGDTILYNGGYRDGYGGELIVSDGTTNGTGLLKDIYPGSQGSYPVYPSLGEGYMVFRASNDEARSELWKTDGTTDGTVLVKDIYRTTEDADPINLTDLDGTLYFRATDSTHGRELWKVTDPAAGAQIIRDINPDENADSGKPFFFGGKIYFAATDGLSGTELWQSDGTEAGTSLFKDLNPGSGSSMPSNFVKAGDVFYFYADDGTSGLELWKSDGTPEGTVFIKDVANFIFTAPISDLVALGNKIYFVGFEFPQTGLEIWTSDGTADGTNYLMDVRTGRTGDLPTSLTVVGSTLFFAMADLDGAGNELWKTTGGDPEQVKDVNPSGASNPANFAARDSTTLFFTADDGTNGIELWRTEGTELTTILVKDINPSGSSAPANLQMAGNRLFFTADDGSHGIELWTSDGTPEGTVLVRDIIAGDGSPGISDFETVAGTLFFVADDGVNGREIWKSDGTAEGTVMVEDLTGDAASAQPSDLTVSGASVYFTAISETAGRELFSFPLVTASGPADGSYGVGVKLKFTVTFQIAVSVTGSPQLAFSLDSTPRRASYDSANSTSTALVFFYTIQAGEDDTDGIVINSPLDLNAGSITFVGTDIAAELVFSASDVSSVIVDTTAPDAPTKPDLVASSDSGGSDSDDVTNLAGPTFAGTAETGSTVLLYDTDGTTQLGSATASDGTWEITASELGEGAHMIKAKAADAAGNTSTFSAVVTVMIDTTAPVLTSPTSISLTVGIASNFALTASGSPVSFAFDSALPAGLTLNSTTGAVTGSPTTVGTTTLTATTRDAAGNANSASFTFTIEPPVLVDTSAPTVEAIARHLPFELETAAPRVLYRVQFNEAVTGVDVADFALTTTDTASGTIESIVNDQGALYWVWVTDIAGAGNLRLDIKSDATISDSAGNTLAGSGYTSGATYELIDRTTSIHAWGNNDDGVLGNGTSGEDHNAFAPIGVDVTGALANQHIIAVSAGGEHALALGADGAVYAWGNNSSGALGDGTFTNTPSPVAVDRNGVLAGHTIVAISAGGNHSLALSKDGKVFAWGSDYFGLLGNGGTDEESNVPVEVDTGGVLAGKTIVGISAGTSFNLVLASDGTIYSWGRGQFWSLGNGQTVDSAVPVAVLTDGVLAGKSVVSISTGTSHALVVASDGTTFGWGHNQTGKLGDGTRDSTASPVAVVSDGALAGKSMSTTASGYFHSLGLTSDGALFGWGYNEEGFIDPAVSEVLTLSPIAISLRGSLVGKSIVSMAAAESNSLVLDSEGVIHIWGANPGGSLGTGNANESFFTNDPVLVSTDPGASSLAGHRVISLGSPSNGPSSYSLVLAYKVAPTITAVSGPSAASYQAGDKLAFKAKMDEPVVVDTTNGSPRLAIVVGDTTVYATYVEDSSSGTVLAFAYTIQSEDGDTDGIVLTSAFDLNGATIKSSIYGGDANLTFTAPDTSEVLIASAPDAPSTPDLAASSDSGASATDNITNDNTPTLTGTAEAGSTVKLYDTDGITLLGSAPATDGTWEITTSALADGAHTLTATATDAANNISEASAGLTLTIDTAAPSITSSATTSLVYGSGVVYTITATGSPTSFSVSDLGSAITVNATTGALAGTPGTVGTIGGSVSATDAAGNTDSIDLTLTVNRRELAISGLSAQDKTYNGSNAATLATADVELIGAITTDNVSLDLTDASAAFASAAVGGHQVDVTGLALSGTHADNYTLSTPFVTYANIDPKTLTVTGLVTKTKVYDGSFEATLDTTAATLSGTITGDDVGLDSSGVNATYANADAGTDKAVSVTGLALSGTDSANYSLTQPATTGDISPRALTVSDLAVKNKVYDGNDDATLDGTAAALVGVVNGDIVGLNLTDATARFANANTGIGKAITVTGATVTGTDAGNYTLTQPTGITADITPKPLTVTGITAENRTYDATTNATVDGSGATLVGVVSDDAVSPDVDNLAGSFTTKSAGTNKTVNLTGITLTGAAATDYSVTQPTTTASISPATVTVSGITAETKAYDGTTDATLDLAGATLEAVISGDTVALDATNVVGAFADAAMGEDKTVTITALALAGADAANYSIASVTTTADITAKALTVTGVTAAPKTYDANTDASLDTTTASLVGVVDDEDVTLSVDTATGTFADAATGPDKTVTIAGLTLSGDDVDNYTLTQPTTTATITAKSLTLSGITASNKVYDATTDATLLGTSVALDGVINDDDVSPDVSTLSGTFSDKTVGIGKLITVTGVALSGSAAANYTITAPTDLTANITAAELTVQGASTSPKIYDGSTTAAANVSGASLVGIRTGDDVSLDTTSASATFDSPSIGVGKPVTFGGLSLGGDDAPNYTLTPPVLTADITHLGVSVTGITAENRAYDATVQATLNTATAVLVGAVGGDDVALVLTSAIATFADASIGTAKPVTITGIPLSGTDAGNYALTQPSTTADITAATVTVTGLVIQDKVYDATTTATIDFSGLGLTGIVGSEGVTLEQSSVTASFADKNVGTAKAVTLSGSLLAGAAAGNYSLTVPSDLTADITPAELTLPGLVIATKAYDGTTTASLVTTGGTLGGVQGSDDVAPDYSDMSVTFDNASVGTGKAVTLTGLTLTGTDADNYSLTDPVLTGSITPVTLIVSAEPVQRVYGDENPALVAIYSGFVADEDASVLTGEPVLTTDATRTSPIGDTYIITVEVGTLASSNYVFDPQDSTFDILPGYHFADVDRDFQISLSELLRVIELYGTREGTVRTGEYRSDDTSIDRYAPGPGDRILPHTADSNGDGRISLIELTRVIELYNTRAGSTRTGAYHYEPTSEDGFAPGTQAP